MMSLPEVSGAGWFSLLRAAWPPAATGAAPQPAWLISGASTGGFRGSAASDGSSITIEARKKSKTSRGIYVTEISVSQIFPLMWAAPAGPGAATAGSRAAPVGSGAAPVSSRAAPVCSGAAPVGTGKRFLSTLRLVCWDNRGRNRRYKDARRTKRKTALFMRRGLMYLFFPTASLPTLSPTGQTVVTLRQPDCEQRKLRRSATSGCVSMEGTKWLRGDGFGVMWPFTESDQLLKVRVGGNRDFGTDLKPCKYWGLHRIFYFSLTDLERNCEEAGVISRISRRELATKLLILSFKYRSDTNTPLGINSIKILACFTPVLVETLQWFWPLCLDKHPILPQLHKVKSQKWPCDAQFEQLGAFNKLLLRGWWTLFFSSLILCCRETGWWFLVKQQRPRDKQWELKLFRKFCEGANTNFAHHFNDECTDKQMREGPLWNSLQLFFSFYDGCASF